MVCFPRWIPGKQTLLLGGPGGLGKTTLAAALLAHQTGAYFQVGGGDHSRFVVCKVLRTNPHLAPLTVLREPHHSIAGTLNIIAGILNSIAGILHSFEGILIRCIAPPPGRFTGRLAPV